ncbi:hypothetical protein QFC20_001635 [Naganishia adeliensis]|uniref:Uncharacterized protein n=1 Tax=Naganishia adeliensis TaxID=92952 RepID=A0ACC2WSI3_9TREE|nr:hypothetical protein QFC20_001635 [Naganishia adeliensis]
MSRRREATDLARALALSTQPSSSTSLRDSSPPITPLPTKYVPEKPMHATTSTGGFMDQYHQQLQQAQKHYQQNGNPVILAPPSHAPRTSYARNTDPRSAPQRPSYGPSGRPSVTASKPSTSHVSDSHRSIVGAISLPDSGYHYPSYSSSLEPRARGSPVVHTSTSDQRTYRTAPQGLPSSGVKSSLSADSGTQFFIPPGQPQKSPLNSTNTSSSPSVRAIGNPSARAPRQTLTGSTPNTSGRSSIHTAPPITPVSSDSPIVSFSNTTRSALEPTYKTAGAPVRQTTGAATMTSADDIVADSEGEEDVVQGTLDVRDVARNQVSGSDIGGLRTGLPTPSVTGTTPAHQSTSGVVPSAIPLQASAIKAIPSKEPSTSANAQDATGSKSATPVAPVSTRPKPKRKVKPPTESASAENTGAATSSTSVHPQSTVSTPVLPPSTVATASVPVPPVDQPLTESTKQYPEVAKKAPVKTYGSKNKDTAPSAKAAERASDTSGKSRSTDAQDEQTSRKGNASKRRNVVGSDSELSDAGREVGDVRQKNKNPGNAAKEDIAEAPVSTKRTSKKRAIIASDDETEEEELHTPDSKRRKPESEAQRNPSKTSRPRDSSIDPLDLDMDNGFSGKSARMEVSIEMSPASVIDLHSSNRAPAEVENPTSVKSKTKSPNKVHFVDPPAEGGRTSCQAAVGFEI